jgi:hypothetical protein
MANQKVFEMLFTIWAKSFEWRKQSSNDFIEDTNKATITFLISIGRRKNHLVLEMMYEGGGGLQLPFLSFVQWFH